MKTVYKCEKCGLGFSERDECLDHEKQCGLTETDYVYVAECFAAGQTYHENPRFYSMYKNTVIVDEEFVSKLRALKGETNYTLLDDIYYSDEIQNQLPARFRILVNEDILSCSSLTEENISQIIDGETFTTWYGDDNIPEDDLVLEIHFKCRYKEAEELGTAFLSVYRITKAKLQKQDTVDVSVRKWVTDNIVR